MKSLKSPSSSFSNFQAPEQTPQLAYRPFGGQTQKASFTPVTQTDVENEAFVEEKMEVTGLELQAKHRTITPEGQERLTVLQAKMDRSLNSRLEKATRFGHNFANISVRRPDTSTPIQAKLTIGEPGDKYEQEADQTARQVMQRIHQPESGKLQREELPDDEDELQAKPEGSIQREELLEEEVQMKSWGETPSLQREELPEEELQMKSLGTSSQIVNEVQSPTKPLGHDISRISLRRPQTKLTVNQPGDIYEQEADSIAQLVMQRMSEPVQSIQREALPEEEDQLQMKSLAGSITPLVQRQGGGRTAATSELETSIQQARGNGQPLADDIKHPMEQAFGADFGSVRVHTDAQSNRLNESIQARAFTTGQDVFFRQGEYSPGSNAGKELLAHELTHVVQQNGSAVQPKSLHVAPKENKLQTKVPTTSAGHGLAIQLRENFQKPSDEDNQKNLESKTDTENGEQQNQAKTEKHQASPTPPDDGGNAATDPPPTKKVGAAVTQKQVEAGGNQAKEPESKDTKVNTEKVDSQQQAQSKGADVGKGTADLPGGNAGKAIAALPGANVASTTVKLPDAAVDGKKAPTSPEDDPAFQAVAGTTKEVAGLEKKHPPANSKAQEAQAAAQPPGNEVDSKAQANQVGEMQQAPTPGFDAAAFKAKLMERIADMAPKNLEEADNFKNNNKLDSVKGDLSGQVKEEQKSSQGQLEEKTKEKPDASGIEAKQVTPLPKNEPGTTPTGVDADKAAPKSKGQGEVEAPLQDDSKKLDQQMKEADVTEEQLANSNEPEFQGALAAKKDAQTNAVEAPPQYRQQEQGILATAQATAEATAQQHLQTMHGIRTQNLGQVGEQQIGAKSKDEQARAKVAGDINKIYDKTKGKVEKTLSELDGQVIQAFDAGAADAKKAFEDYVGKRMDDYKSDRYSGFWGPGKWLIDKLFGMPSEVNAFYQEGRQLYINQMDGVINKVVAIISKGLTQAKAEIANGKQEIQNYVNQLPQDLKGVGQQAAADIDSKFEELQQSVDDKQDELIDTLAQKYQENLEAVDARIEEMKAANKGFIQKAFDFIVGVIKTIIELTKMLLQVLARVAGVVGQILKDPIGFLTNLIQALKQGFLNFMNNIGKHLQQGLIGWLTGTMAETGIQMPENFDLKGIFSLAMQLVGFTYEAIRAQAVKRLGEEKVSRLEQTVDVFQVLASEGVAGMWQFVQEKMGDLNALVIEPIKNFIIEKVITAGIEWILSLLTPASAFIKAAKAIYEIVKFFIERAQQIADLINAILDAIGAIASGAIDQAIKGVENALAKSLPVVISFLASLLGLDGIAGKIQAIFQKLRKPMEKAVDWVIDKSAKAFKKVGNKFNKSKVGQKFNAAKDTAKEKYKAGKQWVEDKKEAAHNWVDGKKKSVKDKFDKFGNKVKDKFRFGKDKGKQGKTDQKNQQDNGNNSHKQGEKQHQLLAQQAVLELEKLNDKPKDYQSLKTEKQAQAKQIEKSYTQKLEKGIKLTVHFEDAAKDEKDGDLDFKIVIAPNTTVVPGSVGTGGTPLERVRSTFNVPSLARLFVQPSQEESLANLLCLHHADLNGLINNDANKMRELIIEIKEDMDNKLNNLINLNSMLPVRKKVIKLDRRNANTSDPESKNLIAQWASCPLTAAVTAYVSNNSFEELRKLVKLVSVDELGAALHIIGMWHISNPNRLQMSKVPGWAHVYQNYPPGGGISTPINFNSSMLEGHVEKHLCNRDGNPDKDEPWRWMQRLGHSVTLAEIEALVVSGSASLDSSEKNKIFGSGSFIADDTSAKYFFTTYLDSNPSVVNYLRDKWKSAYANDARNSISTGRAFVHSDESGGTTGTPIHISADANPVFVIAKYVTNKVMISSAYIPVNLSAVVAQNEAYKVWDL